MEATVAIKELEQLLPSFLIPIECKAKTNASVSELRAMQCFTPKVLATVFSKILIFLPPTNDQVAYFIKNF